MKALAICIVLLALPVAGAVTTMPASDPSGTTRFVTAVKARVQPTFAATPDRIATVCIGFPETPICHSEPTALR